MEIVQPRFSAIDPSGIADLVKNQDQKWLLYHGGVQGIALALETDVENGIHGDTTDITSRRLAFDSNSYGEDKPNPTKTTFSHFMLEALKDPMIIILLACAVLSLGFGIKKHGPREGWYEGVTNLLAILVAVTITATSKFWPYRQCHKFSSEDSSYISKVDVVRSGQRQRLSIPEIVVGDVIFLKPGDQVPADGLCISEVHGDGLFIMSGFSLTQNVIKTNEKIKQLRVDGHDNPFMFTGSMVVGGRARMLVTAVGKNRKSQPIDLDGTLVNEFENLTSVIGKAGCAVAFLTLLVLLVRFFAGNLYNEKGKRVSIGGGGDSVLVAVVGIVATSAMIAVTSTPEGLLLAVKISVAYSMKRLMDVCVLVRKPSLCHAIGSVTTLCTNSTISNFTLEGILEVKKAMEDFRRSAVNFKMFTGDDMVTAKATATDCGILEANTQPGEVVDSKEFRKYSPEERMEKVDNIRVLARATPNDMLMMVHCLKKKGHVVAVVGHGIGDAPALREADIGICFENEGADAAKWWSDIVIQRKTFASLINILKWGRGIYDSIQIYTQLLLTASFVALVIDFVMAISPNEPPGIDTLAVVSNGKVPYPTFQLIWVKLIMGTFAALALIIKHPSEELMRKPPRGRNDPLISDMMQRNILAQALYQIAILLTIHFKGKSIFKVDANIGNTMIINTYILCQVFALLNARSLEKNLFEEMQKKKLFWGITGMIIVLQVLMVEVLKEFAGTARLNWGQWSACIAIAAASWPISWLVPCLCNPKWPIFKSKAE